MLYNTDRALISSQVLHFARAFGLLFLGDLIFAENCIRICCSSVSKHAAAVHNIQNNLSPEDKSGH